VNSAGSLRATREEWSETVEEDDEEEKQGRRMSDL
jgi:hypothetical protein